MRSPFALMATLEDVFLNPFAKWACHVLNHARKLVRFHPNIAKRSLGAVLRDPTPKSGACHGFSIVLSYIVSELNWAVVSPDDFTVSTPHGSFPFSAWSDQFFPVLSLLPLELIFFQAAAGVPRSMQPSCRPFARHFTH